MKKHLLPILFGFFLLVFGGCQQQNNSDMSNISQATIQKAIQEVKTDLTDKSLVEKGIRQAASLWRAEDGSEIEFVEFVKGNIMSDDKAKEVLFGKLSTAFEVLFGTSNQISVRMQMPVHLTGSELTDIDYIFAGYSPSSHFSDDMFANKVAFITALNFPNFTLEEKNKLGRTWSRLEWAYSRMGDIFTNRVPASINQRASQVYSNSENYIAGYNIMMGHLLTEDGRKLFPEDMVLLSHWNLRDEIKSNYADVPNAFEKQQMIYKVMEHIACQTIPADVVNNPAYDWAPYSNKTYANGKEVTIAAEGSARYSHILETFKVEQALDPYNPQLPTGIKRNFEGGMEISAEDIEEMFINLISSPQVAKVAELIKTRLGRDLQPYDIWYDGFKSRSAISEDVLTAKTRSLYPDAKAFEKDMPRLLRNLGFSRSDADYLASKIVVEGARGSGHAWGASGRWEPARLRTRVGEKGMDYKGYNIAVHEFGHNVEQTLSLYDVDHYMLNGVPNTAFTEALAFIFQKRDLKLLGYPQQVDDNTTLDIFWGCYEIMGVSLVDMYTWKWLYENPTATADQLRDAVVGIARDVWNKYYEPVLGTHDSPILAIYSHMVNSPMYLPNYPFGHIIEFQLEEHFMGMSDKEFASEIKRIYTIGTLTPHYWMEEAVGSKVSTDPLIKAVGRILEK
ncbi:MAG: hypothetical protein IKW65_07960 [Bacteroidales bacterium]|nr:hypothetical protein [Bacteroidales bacterium]